MMSVIKYLQTKRQFWEADSDILDVNLLPSSKIFIDVLNLFFVTYTYLKMLNKSQ